MLGIPENSLNCCHQILKLKRTKFDFSCGSTLDPAAVARSTPQIWNLGGPTSEVWKWGRKRKGGEGKGAKDPQVIFLALLPLSVVSFRHSYWNIL